MASDSQSLPQHEGHPYGENESVHAFAKRLSSKVDKSQMRQWAMGDLARVAFAVCAAGLWTFEVLFGVTEGERERLLGQLGPGKARLVRA